MARREYKGAAVATRLTADISNAATTFSVNNAAGWPTGGANGEFPMVIDPGLSTEEHCRVGSRTGTTLSSVVRGIDDTTAVAHTAGADGSVIHGHHAQDSNEANEHINVTTLDHHTQYMMTDGTRHDLNGRHLYGAALGTRPTPVAIGTALAAGTGAQASAGDHVHVVGTGAINLANMFAAGVVDAAAIATDAVGSLEIAAGAVGPSELATAAVTPGKIAAGGLSTTAEIANAIITLAKFVAEDPTDYAPTAGSFSSNNDLTLGATGTKYGFYYKLGLLTVGWTGFAMASDGNLPSGSTIRIPLPVTVKALGSGFRAFSAARARRSSDGFVSSGTGIAQAGNNYAENFVTAGVSAVWDATTPFNWGTPGDGAGNIDSLWAVVASA